jgi:amidohydrolase
VKVGELIRNNAMDDKRLHCLVKFRHELHRNPEVSGKEKETAKRIIQWIEQYEPDEIITGLGGYGIAAVYEGKSDGRVILFRAELDALPLKESNSFEHRSVKAQTAHLCGHDGHMTFLLGLAQELQSNRPAKGKVVLLFQPAEETGTGAEKVLHDKKFSSILPDFVFAIHNLPGFPLKQVILSEDNFAAASTGMIIRLHGRTSHAAEPEKGRSPAQAVARIINKLEALPDKMKNLKSFALLTIIHAKIGDVAFGTTPGDAVVMATLRAFEDDDLRNISLEAEKVAQAIAIKEELETEITYTETFPATVSHRDAASLVKNAANTLDLNINIIQEPFKWTEDFGHFTSQFKGALIGLGSGENHPALHNPEYDFPDELIPTGVELFKEIYKGMKLV